MSEETEKTHDNRSHEGFDPTEITNMRFANTVQNCRQVSPFGVVIFVDFIIIITIIII
jgi:hypothetical protein